MYHIFIVYPVDHYIKLLTVLRAAYALGHEHAEKCKHAAEICGLLFIGSDDAEKRK